MIGGSRLPDVKMTFEGEMHSMIEVDPARNTLATDHAAGKDLRCEPADEMY